MVFAVGEIASTIPLACRLLLGIQLVVGDYVQHEFVQSLLIR